jgi:hypothetical protein
LLILSAVALGLDAAVVGLFKMAVNSRTLLIRSFVAISFALNLVLLFQFVSNTRLNTPADGPASHRFHHRAVLLEDKIPLEENDAIARPGHAPPFAEQQSNEIPIFDASNVTPGSARASPTIAPKPVDPPLFEQPTAAIRVSQYKQHTKISLEDESWTVFEDLSRRDGAIIFQSTKTQNRKIFEKTGEAAFYQPNAAFPKHASFPISKIGTSLQDLLADHLLKNGEPDEQQVKATLPPMGSKAKNSRDTSYTPPVWTSFVGTVEASDNVAVFGYGNTKSYQPVQIAPEITKYIQNRFEGRVGGWMPSVRKVLTDDIEEDPPEDYFETIVFGDVDARDPFIIQTWHRTAHITNGTIASVVYGHSYPSFPRTNNASPSAEDFYRALFRFGEYWDNRLSDMALLALPDQSWADMPKFAFAKELMVRPGGNYPKYGAIDRDYSGSEYDGFQDTFTSSLSANLEWGRFGQAWNVIDNYFDLFVGRDGAINMRGPEVGQFGLTLSLLAKYSRYTGETDLLWKHKEKIVATADMLIGLHNESLKLSPTSPGYGLLHGWSESDAALAAKPDIYWQPYFSNSAMAARGLRDISSLDAIFKEHAPEWKRRAAEITERTIEAVTNSVRTDKKPAYVPPLPGTNLTFRESMAKEKSSPQAWTHRLYAELLHAAILPSNLTDQIHDTMRAYGATSMGVVANVGTPSRQGRDILGFISYGHALSLLLQDRIDEFVLFLYTHRYHVHTRGAWNAGEVTDIVGGGAIFCIPAQLTIPAIMRWALVLEHPDDDTLYFGRGVPRAWLGTGKEIGIHQAPTRWGRVDFVVQLATQELSFGNGVKVRAQIRLGDRIPAEIQVKLRLPKGQALTGVKVNGRDTELRNETAIIRLSGRENPLIIDGY